jgi:hypothetical protein
MQKIPSRYTWNNKEIGDVSFERCTSRGEIRSKELNMILGEGLEVIGEASFDECTLLSEILIPSNYSRYLQTCSHFL